MQDYIRELEDSVRGTLAANAVRQNTILIEQLYIKRGQPHGPGNALQWFSEVYQNWRCKHGVRDITTRS